MRLKNLIKFKKKLKFLKLKKKNFLNFFFEINLIFYQKKNSLKIFARNFLLKFIELLIKQNTKS